MKSVILFNPDAWNVLVDIQHSLKLQWGRLEELLGPVHTAMVRISLARHFELRTYPPWLYGTYYYAQREANKRSV